MRGSIFFALVIITFISCLFLSFCSNSNSRSRLLCYLSALYAVPIVVLVALLVLVHVLQCSRFSSRFSVLSFFLEFQLNSNVLLDPLLETNT